MRPADTVAHADAAAYLRIGLAEREVVAKFFRVFPLPHGLAGRAVRAQGFALDFEFGGGH
jgi:hypothetical protein